MYQMNLKLSIGGNVYSQIVSLVTTAAFVPIFLRFFDLNDYGHWLTLTAIPAYLALADFGIVTATKVRMVQLLAAGDSHGAQVIFSKGLGVYCVTSAIVLLLGVLAAVALHTLNYLGSINDLLVLALFAVAVGLTLLGGFADASLVAIGRFPTAAVQSTNSRLLEWALLISGLAWTRTFEGGATGALLGRALGTSIQIANARAKFSELHWRPNFILTSIESKDLIYRAIPFLALPAAGALSLQGSLLMVSLFGGYEAAAIFGAYRTVARLAFQLTTVYSYAVGPAFGRLSGAGEVLKAREALLVARKIGHIVAVGAGCSVAISLPLLLHYWTAGKVGFELSLGLMAAVYASMCGAYSVDREFVVNTSNQGTLAWGTIVISVSCLVTLALTPGLSFVWPAFVVIALAELVTMIFTRRTAASALNSLALQRFQMGGAQ